MIKTLTNFVGVILFLNFRKKSIIKLKNIYKLKANKMLEKNYDPKSIETKIYQDWEKSGDFKPSMKKDAEDFCVVIPPPNVTGYLHMGHALDNTLQDIMIRYNRMLGKNTLWQVGTDHAGIATQMVVERKLAEDNISRHDLGREEFVKKVWEWKEHSGGTITQQLRRLGASCDWSRERFTMDEGLSKAVRKIFVMMHKDGLIYKDKRLVNWDPKLGTAISDLEVEQIETKGKMYYMYYPVVNSDEKIRIATTRPETMFGDTAVAIHPENEKLKHLIGKKCIIPIINREIIIVGDEHADPEKGTGCVKITPAHDFNDFEVGKRHNLEMINILDKDAKLNENTPYQGLTTTEARAKTIEDLQGLGMFEKAEDHDMVMPLGDRTGVVIEPWLTDQWYVDAPKLAIKAIKAVEDKETEFIPTHWEKTYFNWMRNIEPWCISRQLWWGHQVPVWYGPDGEIFCEETEAESQAKANNHYGKEVELTRDSDVLDTWFSSGLWAFSTLGWPDENSEFLKRFYPNALLVTGFDIIFFWVARMMMMSLYINKEVPFKKVYIHGLVRDEHGKKMSKSKGNTVDPLEVIDAYGADALRFFMAVMETQGRDIAMDNKRVEGYRNFGTKLWNASRFCEMNVCKPVKGFDETKVTHPVNKWIVNKAKQASIDVSTNLDAYRYSDAANAIYQFAWGEFCDWYIEMVKPIFYGENEELKSETRATAAWVLDKILATLHPFMPFITEELWQNITDERENKLIHENWVRYDNIDTQSLKDIDWVIGLISSIRSLRSEMNVKPSIKINISLKDISNENIKSLELAKDVIKFLARVEEISVFDGYEIASGTAQEVYGEATLLMPLAGIIDVAQEKERLEKEIAKVDREASSLKGRLNNQGFVSKAPAHVVEEQRVKLADLEQAIVKIKEALARLENI